MAAKDILITAGIDLASFDASFNKLTSTLNAGANFKDVYTEADAASRALYNFGGAALNAAESVPVLGAGIKAVTSAFADDITDVRNFSIEINKQAQSYDQLIAKFRTLEEMRAKERAKGVHGERLAEEEKYFNTALSNISELFTAQTNAEMDAAKVSEVAINERIQLHNLEIKKLADIADLQNAVKTSYGTTSKQASQIVAAGIAKIEFENDLKTKGLKLTIDQQEAQKDLNDTLAKTGVTIDEQLQKESAIQSSIERQIKKATELYGVNSLIVSTLRVQLQQSQLKYDQMLFDLELANKNAKLATDTKNAEIAGNRKVAELLKVQATFAGQIAQAKRSGNAELVKQLQAQQALNILEIQARDILKSPQQRTQERVEQRKMDRAVRTAEARDRVNREADARGVTGRRSSRDYVSQATQAARDRFVARNGGGKAPTGNNGITTGVITSGTLIVTELKNK